MNKELILLISKNLDILVEQTQTKPKKTLEFELDKEWKTLFVDTPLILDGDWMPVSPILQQNNCFDRKRRKKIYKRMKT